MDTNDYKNILLINSIAVSAKITNEQTKRKRII